MRLVDVSDLPDDDDEIDDEPVEGDDEPEEPTLADTPSFADQESISEEDGYRVADPDKPTLSENMGYPCMVNGQGVRLRYVPHTPHPKQVTFLNSTCLELFYGGAGGGGKSYAMLAAALQFADVPGYSALILRRKFTDLTMRGALLDMSHEWLDEYKKLGVKFNDNKRTWSFPSGATLQFGYLDHPQDVGRYRGGEFHFIGFDEIGEFPDREPYRFLFTRLRSPIGEGRESVIERFGQARDGVCLADVPLRVRCAGNPGGPGMEWVKDRFVEAKDGGPTHAPFIPSTYRENPAIDNEQYEASLAQVSEVERRRMGEGDWSVAEVPGALWKMDQITRDDWVVEDGFDEFDSVVMAVDPSVGEGAGDECGIVVVGARSDGTLVVLADLSMRGHPDVWSNLAVRKAHEYSCSRIVVEKNQGVELLRSQLINAADKARVDQLPITLQHAKGAKEIRMATVQPGYTREPKPRIVHSRDVAGSPLEAQMVGWVPGQKGQVSPDRIDALVWALRWFMYPDSEPSSRGSAAVRLLSSWT